MVCSIKSTTVNYEVFLLISLGQKERQLTVKRNFRVITNVHLHLPFFVLFFLNGILFVWFMSNNFSFTALISVCRMLGWVDTLPGQIPVSLIHINWAIQWNWHRMKKIIRGSSGMISDTSWIIVTMFWYGPIYNACFILANQVWIFVIASSINLTCSQ